MATPIHDIADMDTFVLSGQVTGMEHLVLPAVPEFIGALAAMLVSAAVTKARQKWRKRETLDANDHESEPATHDGLPRMSEPERGTAGSHGEEGPV
ncbi:hypothetical protein ACIQXA_24465 [Streptomyces massasporeus]|uniref:hypothetical protein n=1 Tax=Streptomyces massasporeus TaxID=67324 RepID=UPI0037F584DC